MRSRRFRAWRRARSCSSITAYQSAGAGQNLQYEIPEGATPVQINDRPASGEMDFDCLYVEAPTHTSPVITGNEKVDEYQVVHHILGCEYLYENAEISRGALLRSVSEALRALGGSGLDYGYKATDSARLFGAKQVYRSCGPFEQDEHEDAGDQAVCRCPSYGRRSPRRAEIVRAYIHA